VIVNLLTERAFNFAKRFFPEFCKEYDPNMKNVQCLGQFAKDGNKLMHIEDLEYLIKPGEPLHVHVYKRIRLKLSALQSNMNIDANIPITSTRAELATMFEENPILIMDPAFDPVLFPSKGEDDGINYSSVYMLSVATLMNLKSEDIMLEIENIGTKISLKEFLQDF